MGIDRNRDHFYAETKNNSLTDGSNIKNDVFICNGAAVNRTTREEKIIFGLHSLT